LEQKRQITSLLILIITLSNSISLIGQDVGYIQPFFNADSAYITVNNDFKVAKKVANGEILSLSAVPPVIVYLYKAYDQPFVTLITLSKKDTVRINHSFEEGQLVLNDIHLNVAAYNKLNANLVVSTDSATKIYLGGEYIGKGFVRAKTDKQTANLTFKNPYHGTSKRRLNI